MSEYNVNTKQFDPSMFKNAIGNGNYTPSQAEKEFFAWLEMNAQAGCTYVSPEGHIVHGDDIIRSRQFRKSITNVVPQDVQKEMKGVNIKGALSKDTVELKTKPTMLKNGISAGNIELSQAEKKFFEWIEKNAQAGRTYVSPEGHMVRGDDIIRSREFTKSITKKINPKNVTNLIKQVRV